MKGLILPEGAVRDAQKKTGKWHLLWNPMGARTLCALDLWDQKVAMTADLRQDQLCQNCLKRLAKAQGLWVCEKCGRFASDFYSTVWHPLCYPCWLDRKEEFEACSERETGMEG